MAALRTACVSLASLILCLATSASAAGKQDDPAYNEKQKRIEWFMNARFGMFIHFGAYSVPARGEWVKSVEKIPDEKYRLYIDAFDPVDYDPAAWARLAKQAGMRYAVMTARHHDGFCLWDSKLTDYKAPYRRGGKDIVRSYLDAFRAEGLRVGLYYSLIDWHHPDYPHYGDMHHPMRDNPRWKDAIHDWDRYLDFMHGQVKELVSEYGRIDILWLDFSYGDMRGEKWKARDLVKMIRHYQPDIILNNRLSGDGASSLTDGSSLGDFDTPEQGIPDAPRVDHLGRQIPWEACLTMNNSWGYNLADKEWKSPALIVHALVNCAGKNGNLLLNVGPDSGGNIPGESVRILQQVGEWMKQNGRSIYECGSAELPKPDWGMFTQNGKLLYAHLMYPHIGHINLKGYADKVKTVRLLKDGSEAPTVTSWWGDSSTGNFFINVKAPTYLTYRMPDEIDTVFEIELK